MCSALAAAICPKPDCPCRLHSFRTERTDAEVLRKMQDRVEFTGGRVFFEARGAVDYLVRLGYCRTFSRAQ